MPAKRARKPVSHNRFSICESLADMDSKQCSACADHGKCRASCSHRFHGRELKSYRQNLAIAKKMRDMRRRGELPSVSNFDISAHGKMDKEMLTSYRQNLAIARKMRHMRCRGELSPMNNSDLSSDRKMDGEFPELNSRIRRLSLTKSVPIHRETQFSAPTTQQSKENMPHKRTDPHSFLAADDANLSVLGVIVCWFTTLITVKWFRPNTCSKC